MKKNVFLVAFLAVPWGARAAVSTDTVTSVTVSTSDFMGASIALDHRNNVHIVFVDTTTHILKHAQLPNGTTAWSVTDVTDKKVAAQSDLAVAPNGTLHAVYYQTDSPAGVKHARYSGGSWSRDTIENFVSTSTFVSIAVGTDNTPRVIYNQSVTSTTWYGELTGSVWTTTTTMEFVDAGPMVLALDKDNIPSLLSVIDYLGYRYVVFLQQTSEGDFLGDIAHFSPLPLLKSAKIGLAIDKEKKAHMSFYDEDLGGLVYGVYDGVSFSSSTLDASLGAGYSSEIAVNSHDKPMIVYYSTGVGLRSAVLGGSWTLSTLESGSLNGVGPSVVFNRYNHYLAGYLNGETNALKFITDAPRDLSISGTVLDFSGAPIPGVSLSLSGGIASTSLTVSPSTGGYSADHLFEGQYTLTPSLAGWAFVPTAQTVNPLQVSATVNFQGGKVEMTAVGNLFNPMAGEQVTFSYSVIPGHVSLKIYSLRGTLVRTLVDQDESAGDYTVTWDGRDTDGETVASGIYLVNFESNQNKSAKKVAVVK